MWNFTGFFFASLMQKQYQIQIMPGFINISVVLIVCFCLFFKTKGRFNCHTVSLISTFYFFLYLVIKGGWSPPHQETHLSFVFTCQWGDPSPVSRDTNTDTKILIIQALTCPVGNYSLREIIRRLWITSSSIEQDVLLELDLPEFVTFFRLS